jgi:hypothetical protein
MVMGVLIPMGDPEIALSIVDGLEEFLGFYCGVLCADNVTDRYYKNLEDLNDGEKRFSRQANPDGDVAQETESGG